MIHALCFSPNRYWLCAATEQGIKIWDLESKSIVEDLKIDLKAEAEKSDGSGTAATKKKAAVLDLDDNTSFLGVYDGHGGKVVSKFSAKYLHQHVLSNEAYAAGDTGTSLQKSFFPGQRGWRELAVLGDKINKFSRMIEVFIWSPRSGDNANKHDAWAFEEVSSGLFSPPTKLWCLPLESLRLSINWRWKMSCCFVRYMRVKKMGADDDDFDLEENRT